MEGGGEVEEQYRLLVQYFYNQINVFLALFAFCSNFLQFPLPLPLSLDHLFFYFDSMVC
jgi:hypothetical protein